MLERNTQHTENKVITLIILIQGIKGDNGYFFPTSKTICTLIKILEKWDLDCFSDYLYRFVKWYHVHVLKAFAEIIKHAIYSTHLLVCTKETNIRCRQSDLK